MGDTRQQQVPALGRLRWSLRRIEEATTVPRETASAHWGKLLRDTAAVTGLLDRLLHQAHVLNCGPRNWRTKVQTDLRTQEATKYT